MKPNRSRKRTIVACVCLLVLLLFCVGGVYSFGSIDMAYANSQITQEELLENLQKEVLLQYSEVFLDVLMQNENEYDSLYAGMYFDSNKSLHICGTNEEALQKYKSITDKYFKSTKFKSFVQSYGVNETLKTAAISTAIEKSVIYEQKKYSFNTLEEAKNKIILDFDKQVINSVAVMQKENCVVVQINQERPDTETEKVVEVIKNQSQYANEMVKIEYGMPSVPQANEAWAGRKVKYGFLWLSSGTIGFNAYDPKTGKYGIVTNSHVAEPNTNMYNQDTKLMGQRAQGNHNDGGNIDAAFVPFKNQGNWRPVCTVNAAGNDYHDRITSTSDILIEGDEIKKYGATTGESLGTLISVSMSVNFRYSEGGRTIKDVVKYSNNSKSGDSGGPFGRGLPRSGGFQLKGIHFAGPSDNSGSYGLGIKINNILDQLGVEVLFASEYPY